DMKNVEIMILNAHGQDEDVLTVKSYIKENIDVVFCGNDYGKDSLWNKCYPESEIYYFERSGISSTLIRSNPYEYWDFIPNVVRPYYVKKVLIVGGVSTGKSTLAKLLADYFTTNYIEEAGRELSKLSGTHTKMLQDDYIEILLTHKLNEIKSIQQSNRVLFEDTDALTTLFYMNLLKNADNGKKQLAEAIALNNEFDMVLFLEPDVEFIQDGDRNLTISKERLKYSEELKEYYKRYCNVVSINGNYQERFKKAVEIVSDLINYKVTESNQEMK
ncbi:MAG: AAA family ATPase, partial [Phascolarctobacterium sp.]|nr:AAA family ATPase [Phascolarctobacterium sp.]